MLGNYYIKGVNLCSKDSDFPYWETCAPNYYYSLLSSQWYRRLQQTWFTGIAFDFLYVSSFFFWQSFSSLIMDGVANAWAALGKWNYKRKLFLCSCDIAWSYWSYKFFGSQYVLRHGQLRFFNLPCNRANFNGFTDLSSTITSTTLNKPVL